MKSLERAAGELEEADAGHNARLGTLLSILDSGSITPSGRSKTRREVNLGDSLRHRALRLSPLSSRLSNAILLARQ